MKLFFTLKIKMLNFSHWGFFQKIFYLFTTVLGLYCCASAFFSCGERGLLSNCAHASHCSGFSCWGSQALDHRLNSCGACVCVCVCVCVSECACVRIQSYVWGGKMLKTIWGSIPGTVDRLYAIDMKQTDSYFSSQYGFIQEQQRTAIQGPQPWWVTF